MSKKSFAKAPKPARQPSAEEIEVFETTGLPVNTETQKTGNLPSPLPASTETSEGRSPVFQYAVDTEMRERRNTENQGHGNHYSRVSGSVESSEPVDTVTFNSVDTGRQLNGNTETRDHGAEAIKRLTIDLPESMHTRFKVACASTRRKMVEEVTRMIEARIVELESAAKIGDAG